MRVAGAISVEGLHSVCSLNHWFVCYVQKLYLRGECVVNISPSPCLLCISCVSVNPVSSREKLL